MNLSLNKIFLDELSQTIIQQLHTNNSIKDINFEDNKGCSEEEIQTLENQVKPQPLPEDFKSFLCISNGFSLRQSVWLAGKLIPFGNISLKKLTKLSVTRVSRHHLNGVKPANDHNFELDLPKDSPIYREFIEKQPAFATSSKMDQVDAVCIDEKLENGKLQLVQKSLSVEPCIQQFESEKQQFVAESFTSQFRNMMMHLGIPGWHRVFTDLGMDPITLQWFRQLSPERLKIDFNKIQPEVKLKNKAKKPKKGKKTEPQVHNSHLFYKDFEEDHINTNIFEVRDCGIQGKLLFIKPRTQKNLDKSLKPPLLKKLNNNKKVVKK